MKCHIRDWYKNLSRNSNLFKNGEDCQIFYVQESCFFIFLTEKLGNLQLSVTDISHIQGKVLLKYHVDALNNCIHNSEESVKL